MRGGVAGAPSAAAGAIAQTEGYGVAGQIPTLANNPGDLAIGDIGYSTMGSAKITVFPDITTGWQALQNQVNLIANGQSTAGYPQNATIAQVSNLYSGSTSGVWGNSVASILGVTPDTPFAAVAGGAAAAPAPVASSSAAPSVDSSGSQDDSSVSSLLGGLLPSGSDSLPYIGAGLGVLALAWALS
jgi:hypothetical protein